MGRRVWGLLLAVWRSCCGRFRSASLFLWGSNVIYQPILVRYERLVEARIIKIVKDFDERRSLAEFFQLFYEDQELVQWHAEREELRKHLFVGEATDQHD